VLVSDRPYKKALPSWEAKDAIVRGSGTRFDPTVVKAFVKAYEGQKLEFVETGQLVG
jgi:HD-GYP domain-containing protein (c-di-GMP phosphodiesterase class II)